MLFSLFNNKKKPERIDQNSAPKSDLEKLVLRLKKDNGSLARYHHPLSVRNSEKLAGFFAKIADEMGLRAKVVDGSNVIIDLKADGARQTLTLAVCNEWVEAGIVPPAHRETYENRDILASILALHELKKNRSSGVNACLVIKCVDDEGEPSAPGISDLLGKAGGDVITAGGTSCVPLASLGNVQGEATISGTLQNTVAFLKDFVAFYTERNLHSSQCFFSRDGKENPERIKGRFSLTALRIDGVNSNGEIFSVTTNGVSGDRIPDKCLVEFKQPNGEEAREPSVICGIGGSAMAPQNAKNPIEMFLNVECKHIFSREERPNIKVVAKVDFLMGLIPDEDPDRAKRRMLKWLRASALRNGVSIQGVRITRERFPWDESFMKLVAETMHNGKPITLDIKKDTFDDALFRYICHKMGGITKLCSNWKDLSIGGQERKIVHL